MARAISPHRSNSPMLPDVTHDSASGAPTLLSNTMPTNLTYINPSFDRARFAPHSHRWASVQQRIPCSLYSHCALALTCPACSLRSSLKAATLAYPRPVTGSLYLAGRPEIEHTPKALASGLYVSIYTVAAATAVSTSRSHNPHPLASQPPVPASLFLFTPFPASLRLTPAPRRPCPHFYSCL